jgi:hypothetical protein
LPIRNSVASPILIRTCLERRSHENQIRRKAIARIALATVTSGFAAVALAAPSSAKSWNEQITVEHCQEPQTQVCNTIPTWDAHLTSPTLITVRADPTHCSDIIAHVIVDDREVGADLLRPGKRTDVYRVETGEHTIGVKAEGVNGGCNRGYLAAWGGTLHFQTVGQSY